MLSTKELCEALGVSRAWVNSYLRHLGNQGPQKVDDRANIRTVYYDENDVLQYLNANATFSRQTELLHLTDYMEEDELRSRLQDIKAMEKVDGVKAYWRLIDRILPDGVKVIAEPKISARYRGQYEWQPAPAQIRKLGDLATMAKMRGNCSDELIYRENFECGRIRVMVHGRTWFMPGADDWSDLDVLIRAREP